MKDIIISVTILLMVYQTSSSPTDETHGREIRAAFNGDFKETLVDNYCPDCGVPNLYLQLNARRHEPYAYGFSGGCSGINCHKRRSADPWGYNSPCYKGGQGCSRRCFGPNCVTPNNRIGLLHCTGPACNAARRIGCPGGNCHVKRSADR